MRTPTVTAKLRQAGVARTAIAATSAAVREPAMVGAHLALAPTGRVRTRSSLRADSGAIHYGAPTTVDVTAPATAPPALRGATGRYGLDRPFVTTVHDAVLRADCGLVVDASGAVLLETALGRRDLVDRALSAAPGTLWQAALDPGRIARVDADVRSGPVCSLVDAALGGYSHWLLTAVPRLAGLARWEQATGRRAQVLVPASPPPWIEETLALLGYGDRVVAFDGTTTRFDTLVVPSVRSPEQRRSAFVKTFTADPSYKLVAPAACAWVAERAAGNRPDGASLPGRLYVSRADADRRRVSNRAALLAALEGLGFEPFVPTDHTVAVQAAHLAAADVVVGPHGAGLSNLIYAGDASVVELFGAHVKPTYLLLANALDFEYAAVVGEDDAPDGDVRVDPASVLQALAALDIH